MSNMAEVMAHRLCLPLPQVERDTVPRVRHLVREYLEEWGLSALTQSACLIVSELLANVHRHTGNRWCELTVSPLPHGLRIAVRDHSTEVPRPTDHPDPHAVGGRGLLLVWCEAARWGVQLCEDGKTIWAECAYVDRLGNRERPVRALEVREREELR